MIKALVKCTSMNILCNWSLCCIDRTKLRESGCCDRMKQLMWWGRVYDWEGSNLGFCQMGSMSGVPPRGLPDTSAPPPPTLPGWFSSPLPRPSPQSALFLLMSIRLCKYYINSHRFDIFSNSWYNFIVDYVFFHDVSAFFLSFSTHENSCWRKSFFVPEEDFKQDIYSNGKFLPRYPVKVGEC